MDRSITKTTADRINELHNEVAALFQKSVESAVEIGRLLSDKKATLQHGEFITWVKSNLVFTPRTARNYMRLYRHKDKVLQADTVQEAYRWLGVKSKSETVSVMSRTWTTVYFETVGMLEDVIYAIQRSDTGADIDAAVHANSIFNEATDREFQGIGIADGAFTVPASLEEAVPMFNIIGKVQRGCQHVAALLTELNSAWREKTGEWLINDRRYMDK